MLKILANAAFITTSADHANFQRAWPQSSRAATADRMKMNAGSAGSACMSCVAIPIRALSEEVETASPAAFSDGEPVSTSPENALLQ
jgi:hypothetical protein